MIGMVTGIIEYVRPYVMPVLGKAAMNLAFSGIVAGGKAIADEEAQSKTAKRTAAYGQAFLGGMIKGVRENFYSSLRAATYASLVDINLVPRFGFAQGTWRSSLASLAITSCAHPLENGLVSLGRRIPFVKEFIPDDPLPAPAAPAAPSKRKESPELYWNNRKEDVSTALQEEMKRRFSVLRGAVKELCPDFTDECPLTIDFSTGIPSISYEDTSGVLRQLVIHDQNPSFSKVLMASQALLQMKDAVVQENKPKQVEEFLVRKNQGKSIGNVDITKGTYTLDGVEQKFDADCWAIVDDQPVLLYEVDRSQAIGTTNMIISNFTQLEFIRMQRYAKHLEDKNNAGAWRRSESAVEAQKRRDGLFNPEQVVTKVKEKAEKDSLNLTLKARFLEKLQEKIQEKQKGYEQCRAQKDQKGMKKVQEELSKLLTRDGIDAELASIDVGSSWSETDKKQARQNIVQEFNAFRAKLSAEGASDQEIWDSSISWISDFAEALSFFTSSDKDLQKKGEKALASFLQPSEDAQLACWVFNDDVPYIKELMIRYAPVLDKAADLAQKTKVLQDCFHEALAEYAKVSGVRVSSLTRREKQHMLFAFQIIAPVDDPADSSGKSTAFENLVKSLSGPNQENLFAVHSHAKNARLAAVRAWQNIRT